MQANGHWSGAMLWPQELSESTVIDCSELQALGTWAYAWLRERPQTALVAAPPHIKAQLQAAQVPVIWYNHCEEIADDAAGGVSPSEREMLWG